MLAGLYLALVLPMVLTGAGYAPPAWDEEIYHLPIIQTMRDQWPHIDVVHYDSATTPGYHVVMAGVLRATGSVMAMRLCNAAISLGLVLGVYRALRRLAPDALGGTAAALTLPLVASQYFLGAAIWLTTDNTALLFVVLGVGGVVISKFTPTRGVIAGVCGAMAVLVRQLHVWVAAPIGLAGLLASPLVKFAPRALRDDSLQAPRSWKQLVFGVIGAALPLAVLAVFVWLWGGLLPVTEKVRAQHLKGVNPATWGFALSLCAVLGVWFLTVGHAGVRDVIANLRSWFAWVAAAGVAGLASAIAVPTFWLDRVRDTGPIWKAVKIAPAPMGRSVVIAVLAPIGAVVLLLLWRRAAEAGRRVPATMLILSMVAWLAAQTANIMCWHRYFEPLILIALAWLAAMGLKGAPRRMNLAGPIALALLLLALSAVTTYLPAIRGG